MSLNMNSKLLNAIKCHLIDVIKHSDKCMETASEKVANIQLLEDVMFFAKYPSVQMKKELDSGVFSDNNNSISSICVKQEPIDSSEENVIKIKIEKVEKEEDNAMKMSADLRCSFDGIKMSQQLFDGINRYGIERLTQSQKTAIKPMIDGSDVMVQKMSEFSEENVIQYSIAILERIDCSLNRCQAIILTPTKFIAKQIQSIILGLSEQMPVCCHLCIGGSNVATNIINIELGTHILVGTIGRIYHLAKNGYLDLNCVKLIVFDDLHMLLMQSFIKEGEQKVNRIEKLLDYLRRDIQIIMLSMKVSDKVTKQIKSVMKNQIRIDNGLTMGAIKQYYVCAEDEHSKLGAIRDLYRVLEISTALIYCNTSKTMNFLQDVLTRVGIKVQTLHNKSLKRKEKIVNEYLCAKIDGIITTRRFEKLRPYPLYINYDLPSRRSYIKKIGNNDVNGPKCALINIVTAKQLRTIRGYETFFNISIPKLSLDIKTLL